MMEFYVLCSQAQNPQMARRLAPLSITLQKSYYIYDNNIVSQ